MANVFKVEMGGTVYAVDADDMTGREFGTWERLRREFGDGSGTVFAVLLIGKQRAGEKVTVDDILNAKISTWNVVEDDETSPPPGPAGRPVPVTSTG